MKTASKQRRAPNTGPQHMKATVLVTCQFSLRSIPSFALEGTTSQWVWPTGCASESKTREYGQREERGGYVSFSLPLCFR